MSVPRERLFRIGVMAWATLAVSVACTGSQERGAAAPAPPGAPDSAGAQASGSTQGSGGTQNSAVAPPAETGSLPLSPVPSHPTAMATSPASGAPGELAWTAPREWVQETPKSSMRRAQYRLPAAPGDKEDGECVVFYFGAGQGGDVKGNLSRWASQFQGSGSTPPKFSEMKTGGITISLAEVHGTYTPSSMEMGGTEPQPKPDFMLLGAIVPGADANWFFKCTGPAKTMEANRARFSSLLASVH